MRKRFGFKLTVAITVVAVGIVFGVAAAMAEVSPSKVAAGSTTLYWSGQGAPVNQQCIHPDPGSGGYQNGASATDYMLWIFSTDGGSVSDAPTLTVNGTNYGNAHWTGGVWQIVTPFVDPATITAGDGGTAYVTYPAVTDTGTGSWILTISHGCGGSTNTADDLSVTKTVNTSFTRTYNWTIDKSADPTTVYSAGGGTSGATTWTVGVTRTGFTDSAWTVSGDITVTNPNSVDATVETVTDSLSGATVDCNGATAGDGLPAIVAGSSTLDCSYSASVSSGDAGVNTATATWDPISSPNTSATSDPVPFSFGDPTDVVNDTIHVTDTNGNSWTFSDSGSQQYQQTFTDPAGTCTSHQNEATITETNQSDTATVSDCQGANLTADKTATPSFTRTYNWTIRKSVAGSTLVNTSSSSATLNYSVVVNSGTPAYTDSGWQVSGSITVSNPNDWESVTATSITDSIGTGWTCPVTDGTNVVVPEATDSTHPGTVTRNYVCTWSGSGAPSAGTNTATVNWDGSAAHTTSSSAQGTATFAFTTPTTETNKTIHVTDSYAGSLGTVTYGTTTLPATFTYSRIVAVPNSACATYTNVATITETGQHSDVTVTVCGRVTGGLTIGFWSNNNGRAVLCSTANDPKWRQLLDGTWTTAPYTGGSYLRNANGTFYTVPSAGTCANADSNFSAWLLSANSNNASYMLSAQLAGAILNVNFNGMNGNACIAGNGGTPTTINNLIATVITFLRANGNTTAAGPARTLAVTYQTILNSLNNGQVYAVTGC